MTNPNKPPKAKRDPIPAGALGDQPLVAIVGRPNVGKSTLFNRLTGRRLAIVEDLPGVTRDRNYADAQGQGTPYALVDTGGFDPTSQDPMADSIATQVKLALDEADVIVCLFDATTPPSAADRAAVQLLRETNKPVIYAANKADSPKQALDVMDYYELGIPSVLAVSAAHGRGTGELEAHITDAISQLAPKTHPLGEQYWRYPRVCIVGRPNAGKSSLLNTWIGRPQQVVDDRPGTTVDTIDAVVDHPGGKWVVIDTAGIRRKSAVAKDVEGLSVMRAIRAMERSHAVVLLVDATRGTAEQDAKIAGLAQDRGRALVIALNKTDQLTAGQLDQAVNHTREILAFAPWAPVVPISVHGKRGLRELQVTIGAAITAHDQRVTTGELNRFFHNVLETHPPPTMNKRPVRLYFITQAEVRPPTFVIVANDPDRVHWSYQRYVTNQIRATFGFEGTPVRLRFKRRNRHTPAADD